MLKRSFLRCTVAPLALLAALIGGPSAARAAVYTSLASGTDHTCAIRPGGAVYCWGNGQSGQIGVIGVSRARTPVAVIGSYTAEQLSSGTGYWCEVLSGGKVSCTGANEQGQLGTGAIGPEQYPHDVVGLPPASRVEAGSATTCAMTSDGVYCWGESERGQLGDGKLNFEPSPTPAKVAGLGDVTDLSVASKHVCAVTTDRRVLCWGDTDEGKLGTPQTSAITRPGQAVTGLSDATQVAAAERHTCALRLDQTVACWGNNEFGQLGAGPVEQTAVPVAVQGLTGVVQLSAKASTTCAVRADGSVWCWGDGRLGQLGSGARVSSNVPVQVQGAADVTAVSVGAQHACAVTRTQIPLCWGSNRYAQLGSGGLLGVSAGETSAHVVQDAVRGTVEFLPTPLAEREKTSRGGEVYLRLFRLTRRGSKCPKTADVTIRTRGKEVVRTATDIEKLDVGCAVTGLLALPTRTQRAFTVVVVVRGAHLKTRKTTVKAPAG